MWYRKLLLVTLCMLLVVSLLPVISPAQEQVTITYRTWEGGEMMKVNQSQVDAFMRKYPNIKVILSTVPENYDEKLQVETASGNAPDVFQLSAENIASWGSRGVLLDLKPYFDASSDLKLSSFYEPLQRQYTVNGKTYGMSNAVEISLIFYNKKLFEKAGIPYPAADPAKAKNWLWDQYVDVAKKLTVVDPNNPSNILQWGTTTTRGWVFYFMPLVWSNGGQLFSKDYKEFLLNRPEAYEVLQKDADLAQKLRIASKSEDLQKLGMGNVDLLAQGKLAMLITGTWDVFSLSVDRKFHDWDVTYLPVFKPGKLYTTIPQSGYSIYSKTKHPKEAFEFLKFLLSEEGQLYRAKVGNVLPSIKSLLTPAAQKKWISPAVHSPNFGRVVFNYMRYGTLLTPTNYFPDNWLKISDVLDAELGPIWSGKKTAKEATESAAAKINAILQGK